MCSAASARSAENAVIPVGSWEALALNKKEIEQQRGLSCVSHPRVNPGRWERRRVYPIQIWDFNSKLLVVL